MGWGGGSLLPLPRGLLLKLLLLFFLAHPGSAATWADPKAFLLHRYPNRDLDVPRAFGAQHQHQQQQQRRRQQQSQPQPQARGAEVGHGNGANARGRQQLLFVAPSPSTAFKGRASSSPSASHVRPLRVVIGSFVSELERSPFEPRRKVAKPAALQRPQQPQPQQRGGFSVSLPVQQGQQLWKRSAATLVDAYDGVLSFVGSRLVTTEQTLSKALSAATAGDARAMSFQGQGQEPEEAVSSMSMSSAAAQRYDLVGFLDLDPFERSRRYFKLRKNNASLTKLLL